MPPLGLTQRHCEKNIEISRKYGSTDIGTLRKIYGTGFVAGFPERAELSKVLKMFDALSLSELHRDHDAGTLEHRIRQVVDCAA